jgi:hypothetical protein
LSAPRGTGIGIRQKEEDNPERRLILEIWGNEDDDLGPSVQWVITKKKGMVAATPTVHSARPKEKFRTQDLELIQAAARITWSRACGTNAQRPGAFSVPHYIRGASDSALARQWLDVSYPQASQ